MTAAPHPEKVVCRLSETVSGGGIQRSWGGYTGRKNRGDGEQVVYCGGGGRRDRLTSTMASQLVCGSVRLT